MHNKKDDNEYIGYCLIAVTVFLMYLIAAKYSYLYHMSQVPRGDPFSYTIGFFEILDLLNKHIGQWYWLIAFVLCIFCFLIFKLFKVPFSIALMTFLTLGFVTALSTAALLFKLVSYYWLIYFTTCILFPLLVKEPFSIVLVNFVIFGFALASIFRLARNLKFSVAASFLLSSILWLFPSNYGFLHPVSLVQMQLDAAFLSTVIIAVSSTLVYALNIEKTINAFWAGISIGIAIWGRGNSLPYILISAGFPFLVVIYETCKAVVEGPKKKIIYNIIIFLAPIIFMISSFYLINWSVLARYYSPHIQAIKEQSFTINFAGVLTCLEKIPAVFFSLAHPAYMTIGLHVFVLTSLIVTFYMSKYRLKPKAIKIISLTGFCIFYGILAFNLILFNSSGFVNLPPHVYVLMLAGLVFSAFALFALIPIAKYNARIDKNKLLIIVIVSILCYGNYFSAKNISNVDSSAATPLEVETFACRLDSFLRGRSISLLWYEMYNAPIINYYRIKNHLPAILFYSNNYFSAMWGPQAKNNENIRLGIKKTFQEADFVIIPEFSDSYSLNESYAFYHQRDDIASYLNSYESPKFVIRKILHEPGSIRLLLLQKEDAAKKEGITGITPLVIPYGSSTTLKRLNYNSVPSDKFISPLELLPKE